MEGVEPDTDPNGHGTWLAGIVGATLDNNEGIAGAGPGALKVLPVTVIGPDGSGSDGDIINGLVNAVDNGADVVLRAEDGSLSDGSIVGRLARTAASIGDAATTGNGRIDLGRAWSDESIDPIKPLGGHNAAEGPYVGPFTPPPPLPPPDDGGTTPPPTYSVQAVAFRSAASNGCAGRPDDRVERRVCPKRWHGHPQRHGLFAGAHVFAHLQRPDHRLCHGHCSPVSTSYRSSRAARSWIGGCHNRARHLRQLASRARPCPTNSSGGAGPARSRRFPDR